MFNGILIGCGGIGRHHLRVMRSFREVRLLGVVDPRPLDLEAVTLWTNLERALRDLSDRGETVDFAVVATPVETHFELARRLLSAGIHTLLEKPVGATSGEARVLERLAKDSGKVLLVGHSERFNPAYQVFLQQFQQGITGPVYRIEINRSGPYPQNPPRSGAAIDLAVHDLEILTRTMRFSRPQWIFARNERRIHAECEDGVNAMMGYAPDVLVQMTVNWLAPRKNRSMNVFGHRGMLHCDFFHRRVIFFENLYQRSRPDEYGIGGIEVGAETSFDIPDREPLVAEHEAFLQAIRRGECDWDSLNSACIAVEIVDAIQRASEKGQLIFWEEL